MRILQLCTSDTGGAGRAAYRLHRGLQAVGVDSQMMVQIKQCDDRAVSAAAGFVDKLDAKLKIAEQLDRLPLKFNSASELAEFSLNWAANRQLPRIVRHNPDAIVLHWISHGFLSIETIAKLRKPTIWTLHDMWPFTGGCHYNQECERYLLACGNCPSLHSDSDRDLSSWVWKRKQRSWRLLDLTAVAPSRWLAECASASSLFEQIRVEVIPNGLDLAVYQPIDRQLARQRLNIASDKLTILYGAMNAMSTPRKGFELLQLALHQLGKTEWRDRIELIVFGASRPEHPLDFGFKTHYIGSLSDDIALSFVYAAADVFVAPSIQDNLPNTVLEATACGTPTVAFDIGGMPDLIDPYHTGYLAAPFDIADLVKGIVWTLEDRSRHQQLSHQAREKAVREFSLELQAKRYHRLAAELVANRSHLPPESS